MNNAADRYVLDAAHTRRRFALHGIALAAGSRAYRRDERKSPVRALYDVLARILKRWGGQSMTQPLLANPKRQQETQK